MRIPSEPADERFPINVMNMIDVFLLLLVFFLVATTFIQEERDTRVQLPGTASVRPLSAPTRDMVINIREDGSVRINAKDVSAAELEATLKTAAREDPDRNVLIRADERSFMKYFAAVAMQCRDAGFSQVRIGYVIENAKNHATP
jgi:biopolymer transport protein ExbD